MPMSTSSGAAPRAAPASDNGQRQASVDQGAQPTASPDLEPVRVSRVLRLRAAAVADRRAVGAVFITAGGGPGGQERERVTCGRARFGSVGSER
jgi:hypothetical protein